MLVLRFILSRKLGNKMKLINHNKNLLYCILLNKFVFVCSVISKIAFSFHRFSINWIIHILFETACYFIADCHAGGRLNPPPLLSLCHSAEINCQINAWFVPRSATNSSDFVYSRRDRSSIVQHWFAPTLNVQTGQGMFMRECLTAGLPQ